MAHMKQSKVSKQERAHERREKRALTSTSKAARKLRKQVIEEDFGHVPIR